jgi:hypothetical protein
MPANQKDQANILAIVRRPWPGDLSEDFDYSEVSPSCGSSEEWDGVSEPSIPRLSDVDYGDQSNTEESEDAKSDTDSEGDVNNEESIGSAGYVHNLCLSIPPVSHYRCGIRLTVDHLNMLQRHVAEFRKSDLERRVAITRTCVEWIQARWKGHAEFDSKEVEKVCSASNCTILLFCQHFLACQAVSVQ